MLTQRQTQRRRLLRLAAQQRGYFTAAQAVEIGYSYQAQKHQVDYGNWLRVGRGLFRLPEWPTDEHDHLERWTLWSGGVAVVSHLSALSVHDLGDVDPARVHLSVPAGFRQPTGPATSVSSRQDQAPVVAAGPPQCAAAGYISHASFTPRNPAKH